MSVTSVPPSSTQRLRQRGRIRLGASAALLVLAVGLGVAYWLISQPPRVERRPPPEVPPPVVDVIEATRGPAAPQIHGYGRVLAERETFLSSRVAGHLDAFAPGVVPGRVVAAGEPLLAIDDSDYRLALRAAQAELSQAEAELATERGEQLRAQSEYQSFGRELPAERRALVLREPQLRAAEAGVARARVALEQAELDLSRTQLTSPYRAMIQARLVGSGSEISAGTELLHLVDVSHFWVQLSLPGEALSWIDAGQTEDDATSGAEVRLTSRGWPAGAERRGRVLSVLPALDEGGLQTQLLVQVDDPLALDSDGPALRLGDLLRAEIIASPRDDLFALPAQALRPGDEVWQLDDEDRLRRARVEVLHRGEDQILISAGLETGERIVVSNLGQPRDGMRLRPRTLGSTELARQFGEAGDES
ncbi:RND family efflux transporter, MFP subunit [Franzmannia pantelleriensis]|uniref:RND family efflux transporter, MFP subunit n=1 Tax=Franzmannia pantelleriensis TaxID=48727 RepID=A0A1G9JFL3_9GAMM|nr:efflux RND transporter periplasmic adaptor subunit [Halomonas pantelleriensis]SDL36369.1 RND family efflux transporter, MFP subunit [Halomonas pantelleriensis]